MRASLWALAIACAVSPLASGCTRKLSIEVVLIAPISPDPFQGVGEVRMRALVSGRIVDVGGGRWDQGKLDLAQTVDPEVERLVVEGRSPSGRLLSSGVSAPLSLLREPPTGPISILFARVGEISELSIHGAARRGGRAVELADERVLFTGGSGDDGSVLEETEIFDAQRIDTLRGPVITGGRTGDFAARGLPGGEVVIALGSSPDVAVLNANAETSRVASNPSFVARAGASVVAVSDSVVLIAGGDDSIAVSSEVDRLNPATLSIERSGSLPEPRSEAGADRIGGDRALLAGGRSTSDPSALLGTAVAFDPSAGRVSLPPIPLLHRVRSAALKTTLAGSAIIAGGFGPGGATSSTVGAIVAPPERLLSLGDTSTVTLARLAPGSGKGELIDLRDGSMLFVPAESVDLTWIRLLPSGSDRVEHIDGAKLIGGRGLAGSVVLRAEDGRYFWFNAGTTAVFGSVGIGEVLSASGTRPTFGVIPLRPAAWTIDQHGLTGVLLPGVAPQPGVAPAELAVLGDATFQDFDLTMALTLAPNSQAALVFGLANGALDEVAFTGQNAVISRSDATGARITIACAGLMTEKLAAGGVERLRVRRTGDELRIDGEADNTDDVVCTLPSSQPGSIAFGVISGQVTLVELAIVASSSL